MRLCPFDCEPASFVLNHRPRYPFEPLHRVITVSIETMKIVRALPPLEN